MTILSSGRRSASSSTDSNCAALTGMASKASPAAASSFWDSITPSCSSQRGSGSLLMRWRTPTSFPRALERLRRCVGVGKRQPANHAANELDLVAEIETLLGLPADLMQHLHQHRSLDAAAVELRTQVVGREIARQAITDLIRPRIGVPPPPPEMVMRIDHGLIRSGSRRPATILALFPRPSAPPIIVAETPQFNRVCAA